MPSASILVSLLLAAVLLAGCAATTPPKQPAATREFYVFNGGLEFNETTVGVPHDLFVPSQITVNKGDTVTIHFYNTEEDEDHTFTIDAPYTFDQTVHPGTWANTTFVANTAGVYGYHCELHQPTMNGQLIVIG